MKNNKIRTTKQHNKTNIVYTKYTNKNDVHNKRRDESFNDKHHKYSVFGVLVFGVVYYFVVCGVWVKLIRSVNINKIK